MENTERISLYAVQNGSITELLTADDETALEALTPRQRRRARRKGASSHEHLPGTRCTICRPLPRPDDAPPPWRPSPGSVPKLISRPRG